MSSVQPLLVVDGLSLSYGLVQAVRDAHFKLRRAKCWVFAVTMAREKQHRPHAFGPDSPGLRQHCHRWSGRNFTGVHDAQAQGMALVDQEFSVISALTVAENMALGEPGLGIGGRISKSECRQDWMLLVWRV